ncbi:MAG: hypothetical protein IAG13_29595 [Deltaproteobacteria bacterium]|nr:hypothetical protein [Nannocystaceae bacterium]
MVAALLLEACTTVRQGVPAKSSRASVRIDPSETADCQRTTGRQRGFEEVELAGPVTDPELAAFLVEVPVAVRRTAQAVGLEPVLAALLRDKATSGEQRSLERVSMRLQVVMRMSSLEIELAALLFEADCTGDQMEAALRELDQRNARRELAFTISSIAIGAAAGIGAGAWSLGSDDVRGPAALGIGGGVASAGLGIAALVPARGKVVFPHARNLFVPIVTGEDPQGLYPRFVFRLLTATRDLGGPTARDELLAEWERIIADEVPASRRELARAVLFGEGGVYDGDLVDVRERMFDALESQLNAFDRELELLYRFASRVLEEPQAEAPKSATSPACAGTRCRGG